MRDEVSFGLKADGASMDQNGVYSPNRQVAMGFTLVELLVSVAIVLVMLLVFVKTTSIVSDVWTRSTGRTEQFRNARNAFETMTRRLSEATLNPYWDYIYNSSGVPTGFVRQSDLRFICGPVVTMASIQRNSAPYEGEIPLFTGTDNVGNSEAIFFQAPTGVVSGTSGLGSLRGVHYWVQTLRQTNGNFTGWSETGDSITGQFSGSTTIERYLDPSNTSIPDYATGYATNQPLGQYYQFRTVRNQQFIP